MIIRASAGVILIWGSLLVAAQGVSSDEDLARLLANDSTRQAALAQIRASGSNKASLLLSWTRDPPTQVDQDELRIGLADAFGELKLAAAVPFLIKNISMSRSRKVDMWTKTAKVIEEQMPAVGALVHIGPDAARAVISASWGPMTAEDRLAVVFVVSRVQPIPEARAFLTSALGEANVERYWAEDGLKVSR